MVPILDQFQTELYAHKQKVLQWLDDAVPAADRPIYTSIDNRDAGFKVASIDTNLFPAGFNNLCSISVNNAIHALKEAVLTKNPATKRILIITEEHTRNLWYWENVRILQDICTKSGFETDVATFLDVEPEHCDKIGYVMLDSAEGHTLKVYCLKSVLKELRAKSRHYDLVILNNDLTSGIPEIIHELHLPIYPSIHAGWHARRKSLHNHYIDSVLLDFFKQFHFEFMDPWLLRTEYVSVTDCDINNDADRLRLFEAAKALFSTIQTQYSRYGLKDKPFIFLKSESGTYGMGVMPIESPEEILTLNRKKRNKIDAGKNATLNRDFILQEGVPTINRVDEQSGEVVIYQIANNYIGSFMRLNAKKSHRESLNSPGMTFKRICTNLENQSDHLKIAKDYNQVDISEVNLNPERFFLYCFLAKIAGVAAYREILELEKKTL